MAMATPAGINGSSESGVAINSTRGAVNIWCPKGKLSVRAANIEITATSSIDIKAGGDMAYESSQKASLSGIAGVKLAGSKSTIGP